MKVNSVADKERPKLNAEQADKVGKSFSEAVDGLHADAGIFGAVDDSIMSNCQIIAGTPEDATELARPLEAANLLRQNWAEWGLGKCNFADPESMKNWDSLPKEAKAVLTYVASSDNLRQALDAPEAGEKVDGKITKNSLEEFLKSGVEDLRAGAEAYTAFINENPNANDAAKTQAQSAAILSANQTLIAASGGDMAYRAEDQRKNNHGLHGSNLEAVQHDAVFARALKDAASWASEGSVNKTLDTGSGGKADGVIGRDDIAVWLANRKLDRDELKAPDPDADKPEKVGERFDEAAQRLLSKSDSLPLSDPKKQVEGFAGGEKEAKELTRPLLMSQVMRENWDGWNLKDCDFKHPESMKNWDKLSEDAKSVLKYVSSSDNLIQALDAPEPKEKADGKITKNSLEEFAKHTRKDIKAAGEAYDKYVKNNPDADDSAKAIARSAALLAANQTLIAASGADMASGAENQRKNNHGLHPSSLNAVKDDALLPDSLREAAAMWRQPGMTSLIDTTSEMRAIADADDVVGRKDITNWLEKTELSSDVETISLLEMAATRQSVAGVSTKDLTADVLAHPEKYNGDVKAAALMQLVDSNAMMKSGKDNKLWDDLKLNAKDLNPNYDKVSAELNKAISTLAGDKDVQDYLAGQRSSSLREIVSTNSSLENALKSYASNDMVNGKALNDALAMKGADGKPIGTGDALKYYANKAATADLAIGGDGNPDLSKAAKAAGKQDEIKTYFDKELKSGAALKNAIKDGRDISVAMEIFGADVAAAQRVLGDAVSDDDLKALRDNLSDIAEKEMLTQVSEKTLIDQFGDGKGGLDPDKIKQAFDTAVELDPSLAVTADGQTISGDQVAKNVRTTFDEFRKGEKAADALKKLEIGGGAGDAYKSGMMHAVSSVLTGAYLAAKAVNGKGSVTDSTTLAGASIAMAGTLTEAGTKAAKYTNPVLETDRLKRIENIGKVVGNVGGGMLSTLSIISGVNAFKNGDAVNGAFSLTSGVLGGAAAVSGIVEGVIGLSAATGGLWASSAAGTAAAAGFGAAAGVLGVASGAVGVIGALVMFGIAEYKQNKNENDFIDTLASNLRQYGITGGERERGDSKDLDFYEDKADSPASTLIQA